MLSFRNSKKGVGGKMTVKVNWWDRPKKREDRKKIAA